MLIRGRSDGLYFDLQVSSTSATLNNMLSTICLLIMVTNQAT